MGARVNIGIYTRLTVDRDEEATSTARQEADCRKLAAARDWTVADVYVDRNLSGYSGVQRPEWERLLADLEADRLDGVIVWKLDRASRNRQDWHRLATLVDDGKVLASVQDPIDTTSAMGTVIVDMLASMARAESANTSARVRRALEDRAKQGQPHTTGGRCYGYTDDWQPITEEQAAIRAAAERLLAGDSLKAVADWLTETGRLTVKGYPWKGANLARMMRSPYVAGIRTHRGVHYDGIWEPALDRTTWERLVAHLDARKPSGPHGPRRSALLTGIATCKACGTALHQHQKPGRVKVRRYRCSRGMGGCGSVGILADPVDEHVVEMVLTALDGPGLGDAIRHLQAQRPDQADTVGELDAAESRLTQLAADHYADGVLTRPEYLAARDKLTERIERLKAQLQANGTTATLAALVGVDLLEWWNSASMDRRRALLSAVLENVVVGPPVRGGAGVDLGRVDVRWRV